MAECNYIGLEGGDRHARLGPGKENQPEIMRTPAIFQRHYASISDLKVAPPPPPSAAVAAPWRLPPDSASVEAATCTRRSATFPHICPSFVLNAISLCLLPSAPCLNPCPEQNPYSGLVQHQASGFSLTGSFCGQAEVVKLRQKAQRLQAQALQKHTHAAPASRCSPKRSGSRSLS